MLPQTTTPGVTMSTISTSPRFRNTFSQKSLVNTKRPQREWRGRSMTGRGNTWITNQIWDSDMPIHLKAAAGTLASHVHNETLSIRLGEADAAVMFRKSRSQAGRYLDALEEEWGWFTVRRGDVDEFGGFLPNLYTFNLTPKKRQQAVPESVDSESKNDPTPRVINESRLLIKNCSLRTELQKTETPPTPKGEVCDVYPKPITTEPQRPNPDPEVWQAEQQAIHQRRQQRQARDHERRQAGYARAKAKPRLEGRSRRHHEPLTPVQQAVRQVMVVLRVLPWLRATRAAIHTSVERWMEEYGVGPELAANGLIARWKDYERLGLEYACGELTWFGTCRWLKPHPSVDRELQRRLEAGVGMDVRHQPRLMDAAVARHKTNVLLAKFEIPMEDVFDEGPFDETQG